MINYPEFMSQKSDLELVRISLFGEGKEEPLAIEAAAIELEKRKLDAEMLQRLKEEVQYRLHVVESLDYQIADRTYRLVHALVDGLAIYVLSQIVMYTITFTLRPFHLFNNDNIGWFLLILVLSKAGTGLGYYIFMEYKYQKTIGKFLTGTKVVRSDGTKCSLRDIVKRTFCRLIPYDWYSFVFYKDGFYHDAFSDTLVIWDRKRVLA